MTKKIIGLHGKPRSGKDTSADYICKKLNFIKYGPSFPVKKATAAMFDFPEEYLHDHTMKETKDPYWNMTYREMAQYVGNECSRKIFGDDFWLRHVERKLATEININGVVLADIRYQNEVEWVKQHNGIVIFLYRANRVVSENESHAADIGLQFDLADAIIENNYTTFDSLYSDIDTIIKHYEI